MIRTPDGETILIDGGLDATSLSQALNSHLPAWQRSLDLVLLTSTRPDHLNGLQEIVSNYEIGEIIDAGMLHPNTTYALWQRTISEHRFRYIPVIQGMTIPVGTSVALQVLWPGAHLHKGNDEARDNGLVLRLVAPGLRMLLLGAAAQSKYALAGLISSLDASFLQAEIVQIVGEIANPFLSELEDVLQKAHPSLLVITPASLSTKQRQSGISSSLSPLLPGIASWQTIQTAQLGTIEISSNRDGWNMNIV